MARRIAGATTIYRLEEDGRVYARQGTDEPGAVPTEAGAALRCIRHVTTVPDGGVFALHLLGGWWEIGRDDVARSVETAEYERRRGKESRTVEETREYEPIVYNVRITVPSRRGRGYTIHIRHVSTSWSMGAERHLYVGAVYRYGKELFQTARADSPEVVMGDAVRRIIKADFKTEASTPDARG